MERIYRYSNIVEDGPLRPSIFSAGKTILLQCITTLLWIPLSLLCVPLCLPGLIIWGRPPTIPSWTRFYRYFTATWTEGKPEDNIPFTNRILIFLLILDTVIKSPVKGVCWFLDELLYHSYRNSEIKDPIFILSSARSGSTQLEEYLEDNKESFIVPMKFEGWFPYIWFWKLVWPKFKILGMDKHFEASFCAAYSKEYKKRHNVNLFGCETWEVTLGLGLMIFYSRNLGSSFFNWGFINSSLKNHPIDEEFCKCFVELSDCIMKKVIYHRGSPKQRVIIKGHFLFAAKVLEERYHKAKFVAIIRDPIDRFCSLMNFFKIGTVYGPSCKMLGLFPATWRVVRNWSVETQLCYCEEEMLFYNQRKDNTRNKLAISFTSYVNNLAGTLQHIYSFLNISLPDEVLFKAATLQSGTHNRTARKSTYNPKYNRTLSSVGVDEDKLREHLSDYFNWMKELDIS